MSPRKMGKITAFLPKENIFIYIFSIKKKRSFIFLLSPFSHYDQNSTDLFYNLKIVCLRLHHLSASMSSDTNAHHFLVHISQLHPSPVCFCSPDGTTKYYILVKSGTFSLLPVHRAPMLDKSKYGVKELPNLCFCQQGLIKAFGSCKYI